MNPLSKATEWSSNSPLCECSAESRGSFISYPQHNPSKAPDEKLYECPLCIETFEQFAQLKWHLLGFHPRRDMIMELVTSRYAKSSAEERTSELPCTNFGASQEHFRQSSSPPPVGCSSARAWGKLEQPSEMTADCFHCQAISNQADGPSQQQRMDFEDVRMGNGERSSSPPSSSSWEPSLSVSLSQCSITQGQFN